jgi:hypothetical protein
MRRVTKIVIGTVDLGTTDEREDTAKRIVEDAVVGDGAHVRWIEQADGTSSSMEEKRLTLSGIRWCFVGRIYY